MTAPLLDRRTFQDVVDAVLAEAARTARLWQPRVPGDVGFALVAVYAHFIEILLDRLNRVPQKNLMAFLDLMGVSLLPPGAARAPVVFRLAPGAGEAGFVPRGTQVATTQTETEPAVVFETVEDLNVVAAQLVDAFTIQPRLDRYADRSAAVRGEEAVAYDPFAGDRPIAHLFYLGLDAGHPLLDAVSGTLVLEVAAASKQPAAALQGLTWDVWRGGKWRTATEFHADFADGAVQVRLNGPDAPLPVSGLGLPEPVSRRWLRLSAPGPVLKALFAAGIRLGARVPAPTNEVWAGTPGDTGGTWRRLRLGVDRLEAPAFAVTGAPLGQDAARVHVRIDLQGGVLPDGWTTATVAWQYLDAAKEWRPLGSSTWRAPPDYHGEPPSSEGPPLVEGAGFADTTNALRRSGWVSAPRPGGLADAAAPEIGETGRWLRATVAIERDDEALGFEKPPVIHAVRLSPDLAPEAVASGTDLLDLTAPALAFGAAPQQNATLYVASREALAQRGANVVLFVALNPAGRPVPGIDLHALLVEQGHTLASLAHTEPGTLGAFRLVWEYPSAIGWKVLGETRLGLGLRPKPELPRVPYPPGFYPWAVSERHVSGLVRDSTDGLNRPGEIEFVVPEDIAETLVAGVQSYWIRARLAEGGYGAAQEFVLATPTGTFAAMRAAAPDAANVPVGPFLVPKIGTGTLQPPVVESLAFTYDYATPSIAPTVVTLNEFRYRDRTAENDAAAASYPLLEPPEETRPTFYLGFDAKLPNSGVSVYFVVPPRQVVELLQGRSDDADRRRRRGERETRELRDLRDLRDLRNLRERAEDELETLGLRDLREGAEDEAEALGLRDLRAPTDGPETGGLRLAWTYWNGTGWQPLVVTDETRELTQSGAVRFLGPPDAEALAKFELAERYWIRVELLDASDGYAARVDGVFANAVDAVQAITVRNEVVGSSNGETGQAFRLALAPVAAGQRILVREPERPPEEEASRIVAEEGDDAVERRHVEGGPDEVWVRWHEVPTLYGSDEKSRHYSLDRILGELRFGDGVRGVVPPPGTDNIVAEHYTAGGTAAGNRGAGALSQLKSSIPYIAGVTNPIPADGGSEAETLADVQVRGPFTLRHAGRAVSEDDFEWLARMAAGTRVARARALPNRDRELVYRPGWTTLIVVPRSSERKPFPSAQLVRDVEAFFQVRAPAPLTGATPARLNVLGPGYLPVELEVAVRPVSFADADPLRLRVVAALDRFLHPLTGGPDRAGWPFDRDVFLSEVFAELEGVEGLEHVHALSFKPTVATTPLSLLRPADATLRAGTSFLYEPWADDYSVGQSRPPAGQPAVFGRLAEDLPAGRTEAMVTVFQEGQRVRLVASGESEETAPETVVRGISGATLTVEPFRSPADLAVGTWVLARAGAETGATVAVPVAKGALVEALLVVGFEQPKGAERRWELGERLRVPSSHLVYSGSHTVTVTQT
jgi:Baseplate J-like protein